MATDLATPAVQQQRIVLDNISWHTYETFLREFDERPLRITYDEGILEIMTLSFGHENLGWFLGRLIAVLTLELELPLVGGGSTTLKRKLKLKGLEADDCFWIKNAAKMRGKKQFHYRRDPPPDLALEIDVTRSSLNRMGIYAALGIAEVWRFKGKTLDVYVLGADGKFRKKRRSRIFPLVPMEQILHFLRKLADEDENDLIRAFTSWVRTEIVPLHASSKPTKRNGGQ
jgi:Uma2 family endonuclease